MILLKISNKLEELLEQLEEKYFDFNIIDYVYVGYALPRSGAHCRILAQTIGNARGLDINSPRSAENHPQDPQLRRHQQHDNPNNARGLDNNFAFERGCDSTTTTRLPLYHRLRQQLNYVIIDYGRADHAASDKS
jgi:hypothetical protein